MHKKQSVCSVFAVLILIFATGMARGEGLDSLIEVAKSQGDIAKAYSEETKAYEGVKRAIASGAIVKGQNKQAILGKYGAPVVIVGDYGTDREKWIYKPASSDFFKGPRISLFFAKDGILDEVRPETI
jgi:hypothetical protein